MCLLSALVVLWPATVRAAETLPGSIQAGVLRITDGDTIEVRPQIWLDQYVERLAGLDAPKLRGEFDLAVGGWSNARMCW